MLVVFLGTFVPLAIYVYVGLSRRSRVRTEAEYFVSGRDVSGGDYSNTSVGYGLQMAAIFLFAAWGILYGIGALWTAVFWGVGYALLLRLIPRFAGFLDEPGPLTLHQFIRRRFGAGRSLQFVAALATTLGLLGTLVAEVDYTVLAYEPISGLLGFKVPAMLLEGFFLLAGLCYIVVNGYRAEVNAERIQVPVAYIGLLVILFGALPHVWSHSGGYEFYVAALFTGLSLALIVYGKWSWGREVGVRDAQLAIPLIGLLVLAAEVFFVPANWPEGTNVTALEQPLWTQLTAQGFFPIVALLAANALWMPVDVSTWQRIGSVSGSGAERVRQIRIGTRRVMFESPATWCLGAVLGWVMVAGGFLPPTTDAYAAIGAFSQSLADGRVLGTSAVYGIWLAACVAVMLSTVNALLSAISFTTDRDLVGDRTENLNKARLITLALLVVGFAGYEWLRRGLGANLSTLLYGAYSAQLSLIVVVWLVLMDSNRRDARAAFASIAFGLVATAAATFGALWNINNPTLAVIQPLFATTGSVVGYLLFNPDSLFGRRRSRQPDSGKA